jgi:hypothetical protein
MSGKAIVLDANILIRAVLGTQVRQLIFENAAAVKFFAPDVAYADARKYLPALLKKRGSMRPQQCLFWTVSRASSSPLMLNSMKACDSRPYSG